MVPNKKFPPAQPKHCALENPTLPLISSWPKDKGGKRGGGREEGGRGGDRGTFRQILRKCSKIWKARFKQRFHWIPRIYQNCQTQEEIYPEIHSFLDAICQRILPLMSPLCVMSFMQFSFCHISALPLHQQQVTIGRGSLCQGALHGSVAALLYTLTCNVHAWCFVWVC